MTKSPKIYGMICEFNPIHNGHVNLIREARNMGAEHVAAIMSGNYVQRGEPAVFDKWARTRVALSSGADLVIELPLPWAMSSAETFARGGVALAEETGCDRLVFGSECGDTDAILRLADVLNSDDYKGAFRQSLEENPGKSYAAVSQLAVEKILGKMYSEILSNPNNTLAVCYCRELLKTGSRIEPVTMLRHEESVSSPSATSLRGLIRSGSLDEIAPLVPKYAFEIYRNTVIDGKAPADIKYIERAVLSKLRSMNCDDFTDLPDISEGIENILYSSIGKAISIEELYARIKSKRYTHARIRRLVLNAFLGIRKEYSESKPPYIRILGMSRAGKKIIHYISKTSEIPLLMRHSDSERLSPEVKAIYDLECRADDIYALTSPKPQPCGLDMSTGIIVQ